MPPPGLSQVGDEPYIWSLSKPRFFYPVYCQRKQKSVSMFALDQWISTDLTMDSIWRRIELHLDSSLV